MATSSTHLDGKLKTQFKLKLPAPSVGYSTKEGRELFRSALAAGYAEAFFRLSEQFRTQDDPAFCGLSTLVMALNSMEIDSGRPWKGCWRYYHEKMLSCCVSLEEVKKSGITLDEFVCLAQCNGATATVVRPPMIESEELPSTNNVAENLEVSKACLGCLSDTGANKGLNPLGLFRQVVKDASQHSDGKKVLIVSYSRKVLNQTGDGHFSPIAAYDPESDRALVMDVARFKLPPHWVKLEDLWKAMSALDQSTGKPRGYVLLEPSFVNSTFVFLLRADQQHWKVVGKFLEGLATELAWQGACGDSEGSGACSVKRVVDTFVKQLPSELFESLTTYQAEFDLPFRPRDHERAMEKLLPEVRSTSLFSMVVDALVSLRPEYSGKQDLTLEDLSSSMVPVLVTMLCLALPLESLRCYSNNNANSDSSCRCGENKPNLDGFPAACRSAVDEMRSTKGMSDLLVKEVESLRSQVSIVESSRRKVREASCDHVRTSLGASSNGFGMEKPVSCCSK